MKCAFDRDARTCAALTHKQCSGCSFSRRRRSLTRGREKADDRIASLPEDKQDFIRFKYKQVRKSAEVWEETE